MAVDFGGYYEVADRWPTMNFMILSTNRQINKEATESLTVSLPYLSSSSSETLPPRSAQHPVSCDTAIVALHNPFPLANL